ncbi:hypothetical protein QE372_005079 [Agrobacterium pusense]|nr:hypothetical protein [Agrobacterium pusense]
MNHVVGSPRPTGCVWSGWAFGAGLVLADSISSIIIMAEG